MSDSGLVRNGGWLYVVFGGFARHSVQHSEFQQVFPLFPILPFPLDFSNGGGERP